MTGSMFWVTLLAATAFMWLVWACIKSLGNTGTMNSNRPSHTEPTFQQKVKLVTQQQESMLLYAKRVQEHLETMWQDEYGESAFAGLLVLEAEAIKVGHDQDIWYNHMASQIAVKYALVEKPGHNNDDDDDDDIPPTFEIEG